MRRFLRVVLSLSWQLLIEIKEDCQDRLRTGSGGYLGGFAKTGSGSGQAQDRLRLRTGSGGPTVSEYSFQLAATSESICFACSTRKPFLN